MAIRSRSVALLRRHLARPQSAAAAPAAAATPYTVASLYRELKKVKAKVDEFGKDYDCFRWRIFPSIMAVSLVGGWFRDTLIFELKESVDMLKKEKEKEKEKAVAN